MLIIPVKTIPNLTVGLLSNVIVIFPLEILFLEINYEILNLKIQKNEKQSREEQEIIGILPSNL